MESIGAYLQRQRELRQVSLEELVQTTRVPLKMLQHLESDRFDELPGDVFARGFMRSYARTLGLDEAEVLRRFDRDRNVDLSAPPPPLASIDPPEHGRSFGIAIALVILVILFTLALSIVLNARQRSTPFELSLQTSADSENTVG